MAAMQFLFDLDGTITREETLPLLARAFGLEKEIASLTARTVAGEIPFAASFVHRVQLLQNIPVSEVAELLAQVSLHEELVRFIRAQGDYAAIVTGNLSCWVQALVQRIGCKTYASQAVMQNGQVHGVRTILKKEKIVQHYQQQGRRVVFVGDGDNDAKAMQAADIAFAFGAVHKPAIRALQAAKQVVFWREEALCATLWKLDGATMHVYPIDPKN